MTIQAEELTKLANRDEYQPDGVTHPPTPLREQPLGQVPPEIGEKTRRFLEEQAAAAAYDPDERFEVLGIFCELLRSASVDGGTKRRRGEKPSWKVDQSHRRAIYSHLGRWATGERHDPDSGAHPLIHAAWRCLAVAWQEMHEEQERRAE